MTKHEIRKLLDDANKALEAEFEAHENSIKSELSSLKTKTINKIQNSSP